MASNLRKIAIGGLAGTLGAGLAAYLLLKEEGDYRVGLSSLCLVYLLIVFGQVLLCTCNKDFIFAIGICVKQQQTPLGSHLIIFVIICILVVGRVLVLQCSSTPYNVWQI